MENDRTADLWKAVDAAVADAVRRLSRRSAGWWRDEVPPGTGSRAARVAAALGDLVELDPTAAGRGAPPRPRREETLVEQLRVVAHDLRLAAREGADVDPETVAAILARCLADVDRPR